MLIVGIDLNCVSGIRCTCKNEEVILWISLEPPKGPNDLCPRLNGFYAHPDPATCNIFYACVEGVAEEYTCSPGLWFDEYQGVCNWPSETDRKNCKPGTCIFLN